MSIGNIFRYREGTKLADLEYAKKTVGNMTSHNMRTASGFSNKLLTKPIDFKQGTLRFMSVEVAANQYLFLPSDYNDDKSEEY